MSASVFTWVSFAAATVCLIFGIAVFLRDIRSRMNQVFMLLCLSVAYWAFMEFELRHSVSFEQAVYWSRYNFLWPITAALLLHFVWIFTKERRFLESKFTYPVLYGSAAAISLTELVTHRMQATPTEEYWGWTYDIPGTFIYGISTALVAALAISAALLTFRFYLRQSDPIKKRQTGLVVIGLSIPVVSGSVGDAILPYLGIRVPEMTATASAIGVAGFIGFAIWKYELFGLTPGQAADKIISAISDCLLLLDTKGHILTVNQAALDLLGYREEELLGKPLEQICLSHPLDLEPETLGVSDIETTLLTQDGCQVPVSISDSILHDKHGRMRGAVLIARDITERKLSEKSLRESENRLQVIMESVQAGIFVVDPGTHRIVDVNALAAGMIGAPKEEIVGSACHRFICPAEPGKCPITDLHQSVDQSERVLLTATGEERPILKSVTTVMLGGKPHLLESFIDISVRKRMEEKLKVSLAEKEVLVKRLDEFATHDGLTGLYNHRAFYMLLDEEYVRAKRFNRPLSLLMLDIDHFKHVNDRYGHLAGDAVLKTMSEILGRHVRAIDRVCRYGGEEITVILPEADADAAADTAERLRVAVEKHLFDVTSGPALRITVSIGVASSPADVDSQSTLVEAADLAMFAAKERGRNRTVRYEQSLQFQ